MLIANGGIRVIVDEADLVESAWLVAVTVTVCCGVGPGAVYSPLSLIEPASAGLIVHVTFALLESAILA